MGLFDRFKATLNGLLASAEDPRQATPSAHERHLELLTRLREARAEVTISRQQLEARAGRIKEYLADLEQQARVSLGDGLEQQARLLLQRRRAGTRELARIEAQGREVAEEETRLALAEHRLAGQIETFRARQEVISARYTAAEAQLRIGEAIGGVSRDLADLSAELDQAEVRTEHMQARATAIEDLMDAGVLPGAPLPDGTIRNADPQDDEQALDAEIEALRCRLQQHSGPEQRGSPAGVQREA